MKFRIFLVAVIFLMAFSTSSETKAQSTPIFGFHDCMYQGEGIPHIGTDCDPEYYSVMNSLGGGWLMSRGIVSGSIYEDYAANSDVVDLSRIPSNINVILRLDSGDHRSLPPIIADEDFQRYANAVVAFLQASPGSSRAIIEIGNEPFQYLSEYQENAWHADWPRTDNVAVCDHLYGNEKVIQVPTPEHYARLFVTVVRTMRAAGLNNQVIQAPFMPRTFAWMSNLAHYPNEICRDYSLGDYVAAIRAEEATQGVSNTLGGLALHMQGVPFEGEDGFDYDTIHAETHWDLMMHIEDARAQTTTVDVWVLDGEIYEEPIEGGSPSIRVIRSGQYQNIAGLPLYITETHPPVSPNSGRYWGWGGLTTDWVRATLDVVCAHNENTPNPVEALIFYRWGRYPASVNFDDYLQSVLQGVRASGC